MIDLGAWHECVCKQYNNSQSLCKNQYTISEQGKSVRLVPRGGEEVMAIVLDDCVISDHGKRCDALFLYRRNLRYSFLVEIKGAGDIPKAFEQLSYTRNRDEYQQIIDQFYKLENKRVIEKFAIVSNGMLSKPDLERLENAYKIRVKRILHCEATTPIPDLKDLL